MSDPGLSARKWLRENGYSETADLIDEVMEEWKRFGKKTRRNWWDVLAGDRKGNPRQIEGRIFPVFNAARLRQGLPPIAHALDERRKELEAREKGNWAVPTKRQDTLSIFTRLRRILGIK